MAFANEVSAAFSITLPALRSGGGETMDEVVIGTAEIDYKDPRRSNDGFEIESDYCNFDVLSGSVVVSGAPELPIPSPLFDCQRTFQCLLDLCFSHRNYNTAFASRCNFTEGSQTRNH